MKNLIMIQARVDALGVHFMTKEGELEEGDVFDFRGKPHRVRVITGGGAVGYADPSFGRDLVYVTADPVETVAAT